MIISHRKKFIFIHNYKVAGTSIRNALDKYNNKSPATLTTFEKLKCAIQLYPKIFSKNFSGHSKAKFLIVIINLVLYAILGIGRFPYIHLC